MEYADPENAMFYAYYDLTENKYSDSEQYPCVSYSEHIGWGGGYAQATNRIDIHTDSKLILSYDLDETRFVIQIVSFTKDKLSVRLDYSPDDGHLITLMQSPGVY